MVNLGFLYALAVAVTALAAPPSASNSLVSSLDARAPKACGAAQVAYFTFRPNVLESYVSNPRKSSEQKVDQWVNTVVDLGTLQTGNCTLDVNWNVNGPVKGDPVSTLTLKLDNFVIKPLS
ncbi:hypothetical protein HYE67_007909 [Fusarium culmorum]|uniref:Uncharacterized protein n=1 Tax=Fusarium culmorum TaxID=5516 RepID=A0A2T4GRG3_FUSCU|nr:hypothetical protein FCULG_00012275 [Fusarium culmorum]QPC65678.1 hypothetical protein HYE67_007909 [Fusarium culmorum]